MVVFFLPKSVLADGMAFEVDPYSDRWDYSDENNHNRHIDTDTLLIPIARAANRCKKNR